MYGHNRPDAPVMTVNDIRTETDQRKHGQYRFVEKREFFNIIAHISIRYETVKILLIINEIIGHSIQFIL